MCMLLVSCPVWLCSWLGRRTKAWSPATASLLTQGPTGEFWLRCQYLVLVCHPLPTCMALARHLFPFLTGTWQVCCDTRILTRPRIRPTGNSMEAPLL